MAISWTKEVAQSGELKVYSDASVGGKWKTAVSNSLAAFNRHAGGRPKFVEVRDRKTANVEVIVGSGNVKVEYDGQEFNKTVIGIRTAGFTRLLHTEGGPVEKAFVLLPATPMINSPGKTRYTGIKVMTFIAMHELVHATGLEDADHTPGDVFEGNPSLRLGSGPDDDVVEVTNGRKKKPMPDPVLSAVTLAKIAKNWAASAMKPPKFVPFATELPGLGSCRTAGRLPMHRF